MAIRNSNLFPLGLLIGLSLLFGGSALSELIAFHEPYLTVLICWAISFSICIAGCIAIRRLPASSAKGIAVSAIVLFEVTVLVGFLLTHGARHGVTSLFVSTCTLPWSLVLARLEKSTAA